VDRPGAELGIGAVIVPDLGLLRDSVNMALDAAPRGIDVSAVRDCWRPPRRRRKSTTCIIWAMSTTENALTAHVIRPANDDARRLPTRAARGWRAVQHRPRHLQVETIPTTPAGSPPRVV